MALGNGSRPVHLVLDFDGTLTVKDTMLPLAQLASPKSNLTWQEIVDAYMEDYKVYKETPFPWQKFDGEEYSRWLAFRRRIEVKSAQRVQDAEFFRGATQSDVENAVKNSIADGSLQLRDSWDRLFDCVVARTELNENYSNNKVSILSVNWSESFIRSALLQNAQRMPASPRQEALAQYITNMEIHANEIDALDQPNGSSGRVCRANDQDIRTSADKLRYLPKRSGKVEGQTFVIYVGDSSTDFDCLCDVDLGVWLFDVPETSFEQAFKENFKPFAGFIPPPLTSLSKLDGSRKELFYWAPNFETLVRLLAEQ